MDICKGLHALGRERWLFRFATNSNSSTPMSFQSDGVNLLYLQISDLTEFIEFEISTVHNIGFYGHSD